MKVVLFVESSNLRFIFPAVLENVFDAVHTLVLDKRDELFAVIADCTQAVVDSFVVESFDAGIVTEHVGKETEKLFVPVQMLFDDKREELYNEIALCTQAVVGVLVDESDAAGITPFCVIGTEILKRH